MKFTGNKLFEKTIYAIIYLLPLFVVSQNFYNHSFSGEIIEHSYYTLSYLEKHEQPEWVSYKLSPQFLKGNTSRTDNFRADNKVSTGSAQLADYKGSGYDRGHLVPAGDMKYSYLSMSETFFLSNISPQNPSFNRGGWKKLESLVRGWASEKEIHIVTAGVLEDNLNRIGYNRVSVPLYFYKVIYSPSTNEMIGFVMPNKKINADLKTYVKTVDQVEDITGIDFFYDIQDDVENKLESIVNLKLWDFSKVFNSTHLIILSLLFNVLEKLKQQVCGVEIKQQILISFVMFTKINLKITNHQKKLIILGDVMQLLSQVTNAKEMLLME